MTFSYAIGIVLFHVKGMQMMEKTFSDSIWGSDVRCILISDEISRK